MNLLEVRTNLIKDTGHYELVTDASVDDYTDNGADRFIREGQQLLDELCPVPIVTKEQKIRISPNQYLICAPKLRAIQSVEIWNNAGKKHSIEHVDYQEISEEYDEVPENITAGAPEFIAMLPKITEDLVTYDLDRWYAINDIEEDVQLEDTVGPLLPITTLGMDTNWFLEDDKITFGVDSVYPGATPGEQIQSGILFAFGSYLVCLFPSDYIGELVVNLDVTMTEALTMNAAFLNVIEGTDGIYIDGDDLINGGHKFFTIDKTGEYTLNSAQGSYNAIIFGVSPDPGLIFTEDILKESIVINSISSSYIERPENCIVMPPPDAAYTLKVVGTVYDKAFVNDTDETWWSVNHPELLILAARVHMEIALHRNVSGAQALRDQIQQRIMEIAAHLTYQRVSGRHDKAVMNG